MDMKNVRIIFDIDGTICPIKKPDDRYEDLIPDKNMIKKIQEYKELGATIVLYTSRNMNSYNCNIGLINANTAKVLLKWLEEWSIPFDEIIYGKPWPGHCGFYVDDRAVRPDEFLKYDYNVLMNICKNSSCRR